jgi:hypothetical protein
MGKPSSKPVPVVALSKARTVSDRSNTGIVGLNPAWGMDVYLRFSVLHCTVWVEALRNADPRPSNLTKQSKRRCSFIS